MALLEEGILMSPDHHVDIQPLLRAAISEVETGLFEGRVLELDLCVSGSTVEEVCQEIEYALRVSYYAAIHEGLTPFADLVEAIDPREERQWGKMCQRSSWQMELETEVIRALAIALRVPTLPNGDQVAVFAYNNAA